MKTHLPFVEILHYFEFSVPTFVEIYPFDAIRSIKKDDVRFWTLFEKCTIACSTNFDRNHWTSTISSPNIFFSPSNLFLDFPISLIYMVLLFSKFHNYFVFFLLDYWCVVSWRGRRCGVTKFMRGCWSWFRWNSIDFGFEVPNALGRRCGVTKFTHDCWSWHGWASIDFKCRLPNASFTCNKGESISCDFLFEQSSNRHMFQSGFLHHHFLS
jgi:hypothetical protein